MRFELPAGLLYLFGAVLVILGGLRTYHLGWKQRNASSEPDPESDADSAAEGAEGEGTEAGGSAPAASERKARPGDGGWRRRGGGGYKRHLAWGILWVGMGLFLIISTLLKDR